MTLVKCYEGMIRYKKVPNQYSWRSYRDWELFINQGWREATLIAQQGISFLFEYLMPNGELYLHQVDIDEFGYFSAVGKSVNKNRLPKVWRDANKFFGED